MMSCVGLLDTDFTDRQSPHKYPSLASSTVTPIQYRTFHDSTCTLSKRVQKVAVVATSVLQLKFSIFPPDWRQI